MVVLGLIALRQWLRMPALRRSVMVELAGFGMLAYGLYAVWWPLGFIIGGLILVFLAQGMEGEE